MRTSIGTDRVADVVWSGGMQIPGASEKGELLPARPDTSTLLMFGRMPDEDPTDTMGPKPEGRGRRGTTLRDRLRVCWHAWITAHPPATGTCACGCGHALMGFNSNGRRRYLAGHDRLNTHTLRYRCRMAGLDLRTRAL